MRIGIGYDVHKLVPNRKLILGGIEIEHELGLLGHSDADVLLHAIMDAMLGAMNLGDIGKLFPDTDSNYAGADSMLLLKEVYKKVKEKGYYLENMDTVVMAQKPKLSPHIDQMRKNIALNLELDLDTISIKATTTEKLGFVGREEGMASEAVVLLAKR